MNKLTLAYQKWCLSEENKDYVEIPKEFKSIKSVKINLHDIFAGYYSVDQRSGRNPLYCYVYISNIFKELERKPNGIKISHITIAKAFEAINYIISHIDQMTLVRELNSFLIDYKSYVNRNLKSYSVYSPLIDIRYDRRFNQCIGISNFIDPKTQENRIIPIYDFNKVLLTTSLFKYVK